MVLGGRVPTGAVVPVVAALAVHRPALARWQVDLLVLRSFASGPGAWQSTSDATDGVPTFLCPDPFFASCGVPDTAPVVVVIDRAARIAGRWSIGEQATSVLAEEILATCKGIGREKAHLAVLPAPVLMLPRLLDPALCLHLIERFESGAHFDSGISNADAQGGATYRVDADKKRRRDWLLEPRDEAHGVVLDLLER